MDTDCKDKQKGNVHLFRSKNVGLKVQARKTETIISEPLLVPMIEKLLKSFIFCLVMIGSHLPCTLTLDFFL